MNNNDLQRILRIIEYCKEIADTISRFGADINAFSTDKDYLKSVSMSIMQIGELSIGLSDEFKDSTKNQTQWGAIRGMRNMYAHAYDKMSKSRIWEVATQDIPKLQQFCNRIIEQEQEEKPSVRKQIEEKQKAISESEHRGPTKSKEYGGNDR